MLAYALTMAAEDSSQTISGKSAIIIVIVAVVLILAGSSGSGRGR
ncbi:membrane protein [Streptomyces phage phiRKBJ001]|nr:membrane protein [Streptomyces phage phiRKBJ001]